MAKGRQRDRHRQTSQRTGLLEALEARELLSGVTIITHGAEFISTSRPGWIDSMATAIRARLGTGTSIYTIRVEPSGSNVAVTNYSRLTGPALGAGNGEVVLLLDWAAASNVGLLSLEPDYSTTQIAAAVLPFLLSARPLIGMTAPIVEGPIQLVGHSRGASLMSELARFLGQRGIWVDQFTSLDSVPVPPDPGVSLKANVVFADNYYETNATPHGGKITGALNVGALNLGGAYGFLDGGQHGDIHLFYHGTVNLAANASDGAETVKSYWYTGNHLTRSATGFYYSSAMGGTRPAAGIGTAFGGTAARAVLAAVDAQWPNLATLTLPASTLITGQSFSATYRYNSSGKSGTLQWFLDPDTNPYNNNSIALANAAAIGATTAAPVKATTTFALPDSATGQTYYLEGRISNSVGTRYAYSTALTTSDTNSLPVGGIDGPGPATLQGWAVDPDANGPIEVRVDVDGATFFTGSANLLHSLPAPYGASAHGFSIDLSGLSRGIHRVDVYAKDANTGETVLVASDTISTNRPPVGAVSSVTAAGFSGWAVDPDTTSAIHIMYQIDDGVPVLVTANLKSPATPASAGGGQHGFSAKFPKLTAGAHTITVSAVDSSSKEVTALSTKSLTIANPAGNKLPIGIVDAASATLVTGWAYDANTPNSAIQVRVDVDGVAGVALPAGDNHADLPAGVVGTNHGFSKALVLSAGEHRVDVYAIDNKGILVLIGSRTVGAGIARGSVDTVSTLTLAGWIYSSAFTGTSVTYRLDIDDALGTVLNTDVLRDDVNTALGLSGGTFGFSVVSPPLSPGTHTITLELIDPLTLVASPVVTTSLIVA